ncbi:Hypothetical protein SRAE_0000077100 [Strongyloides ratti]|uniref:Uncharacterized protein n=1 Tax=Strongyloides ratti TaxID=34506 RepID=A0A090KW63_STRRB|nr:Hypothetical protein SRAE_0000077100 [Strongyloides ratti]CEF61656.1 Hypothetical protein SRAE_0000077100 [Strongyloides ratti]
MKIHLEDSEGFSERRFKGKDSEDSEGRFRVKDSEGRFKVKDSEGRFKVKDSEDSDGRRFKIKDSEGFQ